MQKIIYKLINKIFMNEVENDLVKLIKSKEKVIFDVGCYRGNFTENILKIKKNENENENENWFLLLLLLLLQIKPPGLS